MGVHQADPAPADWLLATQEGETHRFRDLTTLHKWIVERKVTREDRVSQKGGAWRRLGDLLDLAPFFDVVAQADRARASEPTTQFRPPVSGDSPTPVRMQPGADRMTPRAPARPTTIEEDDDEDSDLYNSGQFPPAEVPTRVPAVPVFDEDFPPMMQPATNWGPKVVSGVLVFIGLAALAAYTGFKQPNWLPFFKKPDLAAGDPAASVAPPSTPPAAVAPPSVAPAATAPAAAPAAAAAPAPAPPPPPAVAAPAPQPAPTAAAPADPHKMGAPAHPAGAPAEAAVAPARSPKSYDRLITDADRLLENGQPVKAQKLYDEALALQPTGVAALTGQAYVLLDREKVMSAIATFKRALAVSPDYPGATFGLAEAYRAQGDSAHALEQYRRYLNIAPGGADAHAARGQIRTLEGGVQRRAADPPSPTAIIPDNTAPAPVR
jgi:hypothetical protein